MTASRLIGLAAGTALVASAMAAPITYMGTLSSGVADTGTAVLPADGNGNDNPELYSWWNFFANAGDSITVDAHRLSAEADLVSATFYAGTSFSSLPSDSNPMTGMASGGGAPAGTIRVGTGDDEQPDPFNGPFSDPLYSFTAASTGWYAVGVANYLGAGTGDFEIVVTGQTPTPGAAVVLLGAGGMVATRRRR